MCSRYFSLLSTIALAVSSGIEVNKLTTSKDTCNSLLRILSFSIDLTNSGEFFSVCKVNWMVRYLQVFFVNLHTPVDIYHLVLIILFRKKLVLLELCTLEQKKSLTKTVTENQN